MNALWVTRLCAYKHSPLHIVTARRIIDVKMARRHTLLRRLHVTHSPPEIVTTSVSEILLLEAREAKVYWQHFRKLLPHWSDFEGRKPRDRDVTNHLLDIGYHHLATLVKKQLEAHGIPSIMGLLHSPRASASTPLVYDLMEMFRADVVEAELLRYLRMKKKPVIEIGQKDIGCFLHSINNRIERKYYLRSFQQCHTYRYYMELQLLKFIKAVNHKEEFTALTLPSRNENRCS